MITATPRPRDRGSGRGCPPWRRRRCRESARRRSRSGLGREPLREHHLLLVAAGEEADLLAETARAQLDRLGELGDLSSCSRRARARSPRQARLTLSRTDCASASPSALRSSVTKPIPAAIAGAATGCASVLAVELQRCPLERLGAEDRPGELGAPRALEPGDADDLAGVHVEVDAREHADAGVAQLQPHRSALGSWARREVLVELAADHHPHQLGERHLGGRLRAHQLVRP